MIVELRQYTLHPGRRDTLIDFFDREFVEPQEKLGAVLVGQFRDLDDPDRFVWLRGFPNMEVRTEALAGFYGGPVWRAHRDAANATMIDSDNVLLLRPATAQSGFALDGLTRDHTEASRIITGGIYSFERPVQDVFVEEFHRTTAPLLKDAGAAILATFVTENAPNTFPALPVREGENVFVFFARLPSDAAYPGFVAALASAPHAGRLTQRLHLSPTSRSLLR